MIKQRAKQFVINCLGHSGLTALAHKALAKQNVSIFTYHAVVDSPLDFSDWCFLDSDTFYQQLSYLKRHFDMISLSEACERLQNNAIDRPTAVITFDDGYQNNFEVAFPILQKLNIPATIYLNTAYTNTSDSVWFTHVHHALSLAECKEVVWQDKTYHLRSAHDKEVCSREVQQTMKKVHPQEIASLIESFRTALNLPQELTPLKQSFNMLNSEQITSMQESGLIEFGAHTDNHTILSRLCKEDQKQQISKSFSEVETLTNNPCRHFAYPNGGQSDFNADSIELLNKQGCQSATTMITGKCSHKSDLLQLPRYPIGADTSFARFKLMAHEFW